MHQLSSSPDLSLIFCLVPGRHTFLSTFGERCCKDCLNMSFQADALVVGPRCRPRPRVSLPDIQLCMCEQFGIGISTWDDVIFFFFFFFSTM